MKFQNYIAWRYLFSKSKNNAVNIITSVAIIGVAVGSFALTIVLSAFSGLENYSLSMLSTFDPDIKITSVNSKHFKVDTQFENNIIVDGLQAYSKTIEEKVFLRYRDKEFICKAKGVDYNFLNVNTIDSNIYVGRWAEPKSPYMEVVIGGGVSHYLTLGLNDDFKMLEIYVVKPGKGAIVDPVNSFNRRDAKPVGIFSIEKEIDEEYILSSDYHIQSLLGLDSLQYSAVELKLKNPNSSNKIASQLRVKLGPGFSVKTQQQQHEVIYRMMNTEKLVTYLVFTLILIIAIFNVIGSTSMLIVDKKKNIATLWSMGASEKSLKGIFTRIGMLITTIGGLTGISLGVMVVLLQKYYGLLKFGGASSIPYPVDLNAINLISVATTILAIGFVASKISVTRLNPEVYKDINS